MRKLLATAFAMGFLALNASLQAESKLTEEQKEEALARFETLQEKLSLTDEQSPKVEEINMNTPKSPINYSFGSNRNN